MRKWGALVIIGALLTSFTTPVNAAAPKAGATCTKKNSTATSSGKLFTCIQSGKKLVWNKGVTIKKPVPTAAATPTPSPTATIERADWEYIYIRIWDELEKAQNQKKFPFEYKLGPTVNKEKANESIAAYDKAMKIWMPLLDGTTYSPVVWAIMSEKDYDWWKQVVDQQEGSSANYAWNPNTDMLGHCKLSSNAFCGYGNAFKANTPDYKFLQYNVIGSRYNQSPNSNTVNHDSVHLSGVQGFPGDTPCWYVEGQASLYGGALQANLVTERSSSVRQRNNFKGIVRQYQRNADKYTSQEWVDVLKNMYQPHVSCSSQQDYFKYALGMFVWEYLYDKYGPKVMHQVLLDFKAGKLFNEAIEKELSLTLDQLNEKLAGHLVHIFADGN